MEQKEKNKQGMSFVSIPGEVAFNNDLTHTDKFVWWVVNTLDTTDRHCFASNSYIAERAGVKERTVSGSISKLVEVGYVKTGKFDGRTRTLIINKDLERYRHIVEEYNCRSDSQEIAMQSSRKLHTDNIQESKDKINSFSFDKEKENDSDSGIAGTSAKKLVKRRKFAKKSSADKMRDKKKSLHREIPQREPPKISSKIAPFIEYWESQGLIQHDRTTKTFADAVKYLNKLVSHGTLFNDITDFRKYTNFRFQLEDFIESVDNYMKARSPDFLPIDKKWLNYSLPNFLYNPYSKNGKMKSPLIHFLSNPPESTISDNYPGITRSIIKQFADWNPDYKPTDKDKMKFIQAGNLTGDFFIQHKNKIAPHFQLTLNKQADLLIKAVKKDVQDQGLVITPGYLCSNTTFNHRLPDYLIKQAVFSSVDRRRFR